MVLLLFVRRTEQAFDRDVFAGRLANALNYSVAVSEVHVDVQLLPYVCLSEASVRVTSELPLDPLALCSTSAPPQP